MFDSIKGEFTKQPEQLPPEKLRQAQGLAKVLTDVRKFLYLFFSFMIPGIAIIINWQHGNIYLGYILIVLGILFGLFKIRDYLRGTI
jgi:hypothetical protein